LKELESQELAPGKHERVNANNNLLPGQAATEDDEDGLRAPRSSRSLLGLGWLNGGTDNSGLSNGYNRQALPPLESPASARTEKKKSKKSSNKSKPGANGEIVHDIDDLSPANQGNSMSSVSRIQVEAKHVENGNEIDDGDNLVQISGRRDPFRNSKGLYKHEVTTQEEDKSKKSRKKKTQSDSDDGFDTLRLSQHLDEDQIDGYLRKSPVPKSKITNGMLLFACLKLWSD